MSGTTVSAFLADLDIWPLVIMLLPYFFLFRKYGNEVRRKRLASLYHAIIVFLITASGAAVVAFELSDAYLLGAVVVLSLAAWVFRRHVFPYQLTCPGCGRTYNLLSSDLRTVYVLDDHLCEACRTPSE